MKFGGSMRLRLLSAACIISTNVFAANIYNITVYKEKEKVLDVRAIDLSKPFESITNLNLTSGYVSKNLLGMRPVSKSNASYPTGVKLQQVDDKIYISLSVLTHIDNFKDMLIPIIQTRNFINKIESNLTYKVIIEGNNKSTESNTINQKNLYNYNTKWLIGDYTIELKPVN